MKTQGEKKRTEAIDQWRLQREDDDEREHRCEHRKNWGGWIHGGIVTLSTVHVEGDDAAEIEDRQSKVSSEMFQRWFTMVFFSLVLVLVRGCQRYFNLIFIRFLDQFFAFEFNYFLFIFMYWILFWTWSGIMLWFMLLLSNPLFLADLSFMFDLEV